MHLHMTRVMQAAALDKGTACILVVLSGCRERGENSDKIQLGCHVLEIVVHMQQRRPPRHTISRDREIVM